ncbi:PAS domain S-box protein [Natrialba swarupiae]|nr:PAS domain S-box protein [Natrialba swarupiae]
MSTTRRTILDVNRRFCEALGQSREELVGRKIWEVDRSLDPDEIRATLPRWTSEIAATSKRGSNATTDRRSPRKYTSPSSEAPTTTGSSSSRATLRNENAVSEN